MDLLRISGPTPLQGTVSISGSKNAALPVMAASLLTDQVLELRNVPDIEDIEAMASMLRHLGVAVDRLSPSSWRLHAAEVRSVEVGADLTRRMRGSFLLLGALIARTGEAAIAKPGGDDIGMRRVEQHLEGLRLMGARVEERADMYAAHAPRLRGARIDLDIPTVTGTENLIMAAVLAEGITVIANAAREPHVFDLVRCLVGMGAHIAGAGSELIVIEGQSGLLHGTSHGVTTDYIEAGTYMAAAAATGGDVVVDRMRPSDVRWLINKLRSAGADVVEGASQVRVRGGRLRSVDVTTWPHPGFATDLQPQYCALMTQASGTSIVSEALYENRFRHVPALLDFGARISVEGRSAIVEGPVALHAARATVPDIRSGAALVIAALCAHGTTHLDGVYHLDRGYEALDEKLRGLGADVQRISVDGDSDPAARDLSGVVGD
ncbi:MAG: UDP-N-acetylglucosamine 1-carboxyvinyltransferase [Candidatus Dormibacteraeota bacterium]|uniref:UDP-N-acetylglucosamine 1-carboxyvinyltransferase n=1 Tax=Candidatus Aeolococcus gillhamiae TaxID=3127015 RepID=A0A2W6APM2_9BACT|nr:UDP-N-acetylglucosamine 1-carboxyvinyltransferase [Candidatus Dormibacteraeota bacterium]PZR79761.1 MAG: UDP-N-acetylglucosamine 1-carboxyvinyltransferase [Candidatus Dormibacter sp. RRmetagenome_bin12]